MGDVVDLKGGLIGSGIKLEPDKVLAEAKGELTEAVVIGFDQDGEIYLASSEGPGDCLWLIEVAKSFLLNGCVED